MTDEELLMWSELSLDSRRLIAFMNDLALEYGITSDWYTVFRDETGEVRFGIKDDVIEPFGKAFEAIEMGDAWQDLISDSEHRDD